MLFPLHPRFGVAVLDLPLVAATASSGSAATVSPPVRRGAVAGPAADPSPLLCLVRSVQLAGEAALLADHVLVELLALLQVLVVVVTTALLTVKEVRIVEGEAVRAPKTLVSTRASAAEPCVALGPAAERARRSGAAEAGLDADEQLGVVLVTHGAGARIPAYGVLAARVTTRVRRAVALVEVLAVTAAAMQGEARRTTAPKNVRN